MDAVKLIRPRRFGCEIPREIIDAWKVKEEDRKEEYREPPEGMCMGFRGRRRRGKSLSMVGMGGDLHKHYGYPVLSNFPCAYNTGLKSEYPGLSNGLFTLEEILAFPPELENCVILWDEIDRIFLAKRSITLVSEFLENGLNLLGKRNIWLLWACQNIQRINGMLYWQTDLMVECDSRNRGLSVPWRMTDVHGAFSDPGTTKELIYKDSYRHRGKYNTKQMFNPLERLTVKVSR